MTNEQKLLQLITLTKGMLQTLDKVDETNGSHLYKDKARAQRRQLKIWLAGHGTITPAAAAAKRKSPNKFNHNQNWLAS